MPTFHHRCTLSALEKQSIGDTDYAATFFPISEHARSDTRHWKLLAWPCAVRIKITLIYLSPLELTTRRALAEMALVQRLWTFLPWPRFHCVITLTETAITSEAYSLRDFRLSQCPAVRKHVTNDRLSQIFDEFVANRISKIRPQWTNEREATSHLDTFPRNKEVPGCAFDASRNKGLARHDLSHCDAHEASLSTFYK